MLDVTTMGENSVDNNGLHCSLRTNVNKYSNKKGYITVKDIQLFLMYKSHKLENISISSTLTCLIGSTPSTTMEVYTPTSLLPISATTVILLFIAPHLQDIPASTTR